MKRFFRIFVFRAVLLACWPLAMISMICGRTWREIKHLPLDIQSDFRDEMDTFRRFWRDAAGLE